VVCPFCRSTVGHVWHSVDELAAGWLAAEAAVQEEGSSASGDSAGFSFRCVWDRLGCPGGSPGHTHTHVCARHLAGRLLVLVLVLRRGLEGAAGERGVCVHAHAMCGCVHAAADAVHAVHFAGLGCRRT
jgi:hypothetical protein